MKQPKPLDPASFARAGSEHGHQVALFAWASQHYDKYPLLRHLMFAIPNGGERNKIVAANLKAEGVKSSVPDICIAIPKGKWHGLYIELKRPASDGKPAGRPTEEQLEMIAALQQQDYGACVCVGWEQARNVIEQYLNF